MRRIAYLLANTDGLPGTKKDVDDFHRFLISCRGGAWEDEEIVERYNMRLCKFYPCAVYAWSCRFYWR